MLEIKGPVVEIGVDDYEQFVREAERIDILRRRLSAKNSYISMDELKAILNIEDAE